MFKKFLQTDRGKESGLQCHLVREIKPFTIVTDVPTSSYPLHFPVFLSICIFSRDSLRASFKRYFCPILVDTIGRFGGFGPGKSLIHTRITLVPIL